MKRMRKTYGCPVELSLDLLGGKWKPVILARLKDRPLSYGELRGLIPDLSDKVLTERLKGLEARGLVTRLRHSARPARIRYALTERGQSLRPVLQALYDWGAQAATDLNLQIRATKPHE
jgi:DNA-binding HxlR family transcriptional regulator